MSLSSPIWANEGTWCELFGCYIQSTHKLHTVRSPNQTWWDFCILWKIKGSPITNNGFSEGQLVSHGIIQYYHECSDYIPEEGVLPFI